MRFTPSSVFPEVIIIEPDTFDDHRGFFPEIYHQKKFKQAGIDVTFLQDNWSHSIKGTLRDLHYHLQNP